MSACRPEQGVSAVPLFGLRGGRRSGSGCACSCWTSSVFALQPHIADLFAHGLSLLEADVPPRKKRDLLRSQRHLNVPPAVRHVAVLVSQRHPSPVPIKHHHAELHSSISVCSRGTRPFPLF